MVTFLMNFLNLLGRKRMQRKRYQLSKAMESERREEEGGGVLVVVVAEVRVEG